MQAFVDPYASGSSCLHPKAKVPLNELERAIYSTIAYRDVFDFAPTVDEIHRYLHWVRCDRNDVLEAIKNSSLLVQHLSTDGTFYALRDRGRIVELRVERQALVERFWPLAMKYGRCLANLPHARMVGITGSFAAQNVTPDCDIDYLVLTDAGTMWRTRALGIVTALINRKFGTGKLCPNHFLSMAALNLDRRSLYDAQELCQMIPLFGREPYGDFRQANSWVESYLPNATGAPSEEHYFGQPPLPAFKKFVEWGSSSVIGRKLENFEANRKIRRFNETDARKDKWTKSTREAHGLRDQVRQDIEDAWQRRVEALSASEV